MLEYRGGQLFRQGLVGIVVIVCVILIGLQSQAVLAWGTTVRYEAVFTEAGGLTVGDDVIVSGVKVGRVATVALRDGDAHVEFTTECTVRLGDRTSAHIKTGSLLGKRILTVVSEGSGTLRPHAVIPTERTSSPYSLTDAVGDLTGNVTDFDTKALNESLDLLSSTLDHIAPQLGPTLDGLTKLSHTLNDRDAALRALLGATADVSGILAQRGDRLNTLLLNANSLLGVLAERRQAIVDLLANTTAVSRQLSGLVADNEARLGPVLDHLNSVAAMLEKNRDSISAALPGLVKVTLTQGEIVSSGPFYNAYVANLLPAELTQPFIDQAFGQLPVPTPAPEAPR
ncbi:MCE family protein [Nocardia sp. NPDC003482]